MQIRICRKFGGSCQLQTLTNREGDRVDASASLTSVARIGVRLTPGSADGGWGGTGTAVRGLGEKCKNRLRCVAVAAGESTRCYRKDMKEGKQCYATIECCPGLARLGVSSGLKVCAKEETVPCEHWRLCLACATLNSDSLHYSCIATKAFDSVRYIINAGTSFVLSDFPSSVS